MLCTVRHLWPSGAHFFFNCYRHWSSLVLQNENVTASFMHSKGDVTQRDPLKMIQYRIEILLLIKKLKWEIPDVTKPWYTDNVGSLGTFTRIETYFNSLTLQVPGRRYYTKPSKSLMIVHLENIKAGKQLRHVMDLRCARVHIILGVTQEVTGPRAIGRDSVR